MSSSTPAHERHRNFYFDYFQLSDSDTCVINYEKKNRHEREKVTLFGRTLKRRCVTRHNSEAVTLPGTSGGESALFGTDAD